MRQNWNVSIEENRVTINCIVVKVNNLIFLKTKSYRSPLNECKGKALSPS